MKKFKIAIAALFIGGSSILFSSCIGSFALTNNVIKWNKTLGNKFVNELVFVAFWILPVYEVTALADLLILNSIEFWKGENPLESYTKTIETEHGIFIVNCNEGGYIITEQQTGQEFHLNFNSQTQTWSLENNGEELPFMTFIDENHVKMINPKGGFDIIELSTRGVLAYQETTQSYMLFAHK